MLRWRQKEERKRGHNENGCRDTSKLEGLRCPVERAKRKKEILETACSRVRTDECKLRYAEVYVHSRGACSILSRTLRIFPCTREKKQTPLFIMNLSIRLQNPSDFSACLSTPSVTNLEPCSKCLPRLSLSLLAPSSRLPSLLLREEKTFFLTGPLMTAD